MYFLQYIYIYIYQPQSSITILLKKKFFTSIFPILQAVSPKTHIKLSNPANHFPKPLLCFFYYFSFNCLSSFRIILPIYLKFLLVETPINKNKNKNKTNQTVFSKNKIKTNQTDTNYLIVL